MSPPLGKRSAETSPESVSNKRSRHMDKEPVSVRREKQLENLDRLVRKGSVFIDNMPMIEADYTKSVDHFFVNILKYPNYGMDTVFHVSNGGKGKHGDRIRVVLSHRAREFLDSKAARDALKCYCTQKNVIITYSSDQTHDQRKINIRATFIKDKILKHLKETKDDRTIFFKRNVGTYKLGTGPYIKEAAIAALFPDIDLSDAPAL